PFDSEGEKIKESKLLIDELDLPCNSLLYSETDSFNSQDFSRVDDLPSPDNEDKVKLSDLKQALRVRITWIVKSFVLSVFHSQELHILSFNLEIHLLHLAGSQPMLKSSYKAKANVIISIPSLVGGVADVVVEIKGTDYTDFGCRRHPEVPNTTIKLLLFPFSLEGEARTWLDKEPPHSILTWKDLVSKFINQFFPPSKTTYIRNEIINFLQKPNETFNEAWEHFKDLLRQCPHHSFFELHQLDTFYNALNTNDQDALDSAAGGNFLDKIPRDGLAIIKSNSDVRYSRSRVTESRVNKLDIRMNRFEKSLNDMKAFVTSSTPIKAVKEIYVTCGSNHNYNHCPLTRGGNEFPIFHDNIQQFQTAAVGNFVQGNPTPFQTQKNEAKAIKTRSGILYDGPPIPPPMMEKEPEATKDTELPSTENIQPPSVQVHEKDKEPVEKPFVVPKTKTNLPYPSRLLSINLNSECLNKEKQEVKNVEEQPAECRTRTEKSLQNFRVIHKSSISLNNTFQISPVHEIASILSTKVPKYSPSMMYEHPNTTPKMESDEIIKSGVEELVPILSENECGDTPSISYINFESLNKVDLIDATCEEYSQEVLGFFDVVASGNPTLYYDPIVSNSSPTLTPFDESDFLLHEEADAFIAIDDEPISPEINATYYDPEGDILYFENLLKEDQFQLPSMDLKVTEESKEKSSNNEPPEEEIRLIENFLYDNSSPRPPEEFNAEIADAIVEREIDAVDELHVDNSISNSENELSDNEESEFDNPSFPRPPPEPPDADFDFELDSEEEISVVRNTINELECLDPRDDFDDDDYSSFMYLINSKVFSFLLFAESEDTIFDPGISV
nr:reverse transcriptase domain-containing protein [Tanacetum cinerariifolium]